jgi:defect-in-organelle-trafficking protein DotC
MILKKSLMSVCLSMALMAGTTGFAHAADANGWSISDDNKVAGDDAYWGSSSDDETPQTAKFDENSIYSDQLRKADKDAKSEVPPIRAEAIQSAAAAFGAQAGLASRADKINKALASKSTYYDKVFDFNALQLEPGFLPPVISEGRDAYNQPNDDEVRASDTIYKIEFPARLVNVVPRWQQYLPVAFTNPTLPDSSLLPKNKAEKELWDDWAKKGWEQGFEQADNVFAANRGRLKRDFEGMIRFKRLYEQGLVVKPTLARSELGVTGGGDEMAVGDRLIKITTKAQLNPDAKRWSSSNPK